MKKSNISKVLIAMLTAFAVVFSFAACGGGGNDNPTTPASETGGGTPASNPEDDNGPAPDLRLERQDVLEFGLMRFASGTAVIEDGGTSNIGGNMNTAGGGFIRQAGFQGYGKPADGYACTNTRRNCAQCGEGETCEDDPDGLWGTLVAQNGEIWSNIARIEATFYLSGEGDPENVGNLETWMIPGGLLEFKWAQSNKNLLSQFDEGNGGDGLDWGLHMTAVWDFEDYALKSGAPNTARFEPGTYLFNMAPIDINEDDDDKDPEFIGGGINSFGFQIKNDNPLESISVGINWTDVYIYVFDLDLYNEHLAEVSAETGRTPSANTEGRIIQVS